MADKKNNVVSFKQISAKKLEKEKELEFYYKHLDMIEQRMAFLDMDMKVTRDIINLLENETLVLVDDSLPLIEIDDDEDYPEE
jgi:hypothetical protein